MARVEQSNPFSLTKANDLTDDQIQDLWVDIATADNPHTLFSAGRFASPMPTYILGSKGSGKTHLMRYASFALQKMRFKRQGIGLCAGARLDNYVGIYMLCSGLETGRFQGKGQSAEAWQEVFSYYLELSLGVAALRAVEELVEDSSFRDDTSPLCAMISELFDVEAPQSTNLPGLIKEFDRRRRALDAEVNNAAFTGKLKLNVTASRGRLIFGIPQAVQACIPDLSGVLFAYQIDEMENLTEAQQKHVNTLVRARNGPASLKIGARQFGIKTHETMSAGEINLRDSEFEELRLDQLFRRNEGTYRKLVNRLVARRLENFWPLSSSGLAGRDRKLAEWFEEPGRDPFDEVFSSLVKRAPTEERPHMAKLRSALETHLLRGDVPGLSEPPQIEHLLSEIRVAQFPLLEKLNTIIVFNAWAKNADILEAASNTRQDCADFIATQNNGRYSQKLGHFKADIIAQMYRDAGVRQPYGGLGEFTRMSEGQPRALITLLKQTFDWATFQGERPFESGSISIEAESKGALAASDWFYNNMGKAGDDGRAILIATDRLAELFRINRYADNPLESSLIGFSASTSNGSALAQKTLRLALDHSFLVEILGGQQERNSEQITGKYQLNRMLVPKWGLPTGRRGIKPLSEYEFNAIFDPNALDAFNMVKADWSSRMNAPFDRARRAVPKAVLTGTDHVDQADLFHG